MEPTGGIKTWQWVVTVIVIIVLIIIGILVFGGKSTPTTNEENPATSTNQASTTANRITMTDQYPGNVVYISSVQLEKPGWVAIHKDSNGQPGAVIGAAHFDAGINPGRITLTQPLVDGGTYYAMLHGDDGDKKFDEARDPALKDSNGNVIMRVFKASSTVSSELKG